MLLYSIIILCFAAVSLGLSGMFTALWGVSFVGALWWMLWSFLIAFGVDLICILVARLILPKLNRNVYNPFAKAYRTHGWENTLLIKLGIRKWKDRVPELGRLGGFKKDHIDNLNADYLYKFLQEGCLAEVAHYASVILSLVLLAVPYPYLLSVGLPFMLCNILLNLMSGAIQVYLRPKFVALYRRQKNKEAAATPSAN